MRPLCPGAHCVLCDESLLQHSGRHLDSFEKDYSFILVYLSAVVIIQDRKDRFDFWDARFDYYIFPGDGVLQVV